MKGIGIGLAAVVAVGLAAAAVGQDQPGLAMGGFYESRIDHKTAGEELEFAYAGVRLKLRDARWFEGFVDLGVQDGEWGAYESERDGLFGLGGTLWLVRAEDLMVPLDLGVYGSFHAGSCDLEASAGPDLDGDYTRLAVQAVVRAAGYGAVRPFLRAGMVKSRLEVSEFGDDDDWDVTQPAVNVGVEIEAGEWLAVTLEGQYTEGPGFAVHADFWF